MSTATSLLEQSGLAGLVVTLYGDKLKLRGPAEAIQKWKPLLAPYKAELIATLVANDAPIPDDLEQLIRRVGTYWEYSPDDYDLIRATARRDPDGLRMALENDVAFGRLENATPAITGGNQA